MQYTAPTPFNSVNVSLVLEGNHPSNSSSQGFLGQHFISYVQLYALLCFAKFPSAILIKPTYLKCDHLNRFSCTYLVLEQREKQHRHHTGYAFHTANTSVEQNRAVHFQDFKNRAFGNNKIGLELECCN